MRRVGRRRVAEHEREPRYAALLRELLPPRLATTAVTPHPGHRCERAEPHQLSLVTARMAAITAARRIQSRSVTAGTGAWFGGRSQPRYASTRVLAPEREHRQEPRPRVP